MDEEVIEVIEWCEKQGPPLTKYVNIIEDHQITWNDMASINEYTLQLLNIEKGDIPSVLDSVDKLIRTRWDQDSSVDVYSARNKQWFAGKITDVFVDDIGEWLKIKYNNETCEKEVQRFSATVRPATKLNLKHKALDWGARAVS